MIDPHERIAMRARREALGLSSRSLALHIPSRVGCKRKISGNSVLAFERGKLNPHPAVLAAWRAALDNLEKAHA